jgi:hypothetical protein
MTTGKSNVCLIDMCNISTASRGPPGERRASWRAWWRVAANHRTAGRGSGTIVGMKEMDLPGQRRSLDPRAGDPASDPPQAYRPWRPADGSARQPSELLAELRLRLSRLADNHPSAAPYDQSSADRRHDIPAQERDSRRPADSAEIGPDQDPVADADQESSAGLAAPDQESSPGLAAPDQDDGWHSWQADTTEPFDDWHQGELELGLPDESDAYRPWFMSGELSAPWFAAEPN